MSEILIAVTNSGLESIAAMVANGTIFTITNFRITSTGSPTFFESKKIYGGLDPDSFYIDYTAAEFEANHAEGTINLNSYGIGDVDGFISVNSVELLDSLTVEINCYIPPGAIFPAAANEIFIYSGAGTLADPYVSFAWATFPPVTKLAAYGLNFRILVQL